ncbi:predicted protein [Nematostella vectensis]|uniref:Uncharacterized protein n=1 Tax=Nematostella vectensis TaxID=45351 RepID=A7SGJ6_NEMVE|nr:predicted protein [Nematostella vectensis]|eukprot:XP_001629227.1 predicted protein [Nematostella vectensis]
MADGLIPVEGSTRLLAQISGSLTPPNSPVKYTKSGRTVKIPVQRIRCGKYDLRGKERWLEYMPASTNLKIVYRDNQHFEHQECTVFNVTDISAADLRISARFGCLDAMSGTVTLECDTAIFTTTCEARAPQNTYVAELTFHVNYTGQMRDILRSLRQAKLAESTVSRVDPTLGCPGKSHAKLREGLPDWIQYLPRMLYTPFLRRVIEVFLVCYTFFSIMWALWQLYRHVDFIRAYVQPLIDALISHIQTLDKILQFLNTIFEEYTRQWMAYLRPVCLILYTTATPLIDMGKQIWASLSSLSLATLQPILFLLEPVIHIFNVIFIKTPVALFMPLYNVFVTVWSVFYDSVGQRIYLPHIAQFFRSVLHILKEVLERSVRLDPLKAQLILMRSNALNSGKSLGLGLVYIYKYVEKKVWLIFRSGDDDKED